jgi:hypothetical protein
MFPEPADHWPGARPLGWLLAIVALLVASACGGSEAWGEASYAPSEQARSGAAPQMAAPGAPPPPAPDAYDFDESFGDGVSEEPTGKGLDSGKPGGYEPPDSPQPEVPLVVYSGYLKLQVKRVLDAVESITGLVETRGGYVESLTSDVVVVRVPARDFEGVMTEFAALGEVLDQNIRAEDVTAQFTDVGARLAVAKQARTRLLALLEQEKDVKERLSVLQEIKRLTEQIELMESTLATLQNLVDYFTITLELVPVLESTRTTLYTSPFQWVSDLTAHLATLVGGKDDFTITAPAGFVVFDESDDYRAQAADTAVLRGARIANEPYADAPYWSLAVRHELLARGERSVSKGQAAQVSYEIFVNDDVKPRYYLVGVAVHEDDLFVLEAFLPNRESYDRHGSALVRALGTFRAE